MIPNFLDNFLLNKILRKWVIHYQANKEYRLGEKELHLISYFCDKRKIDIDVEALTKAPILRVLFWLNWATRVVFLQKPSCQY